MRNLMFVEGMGEYMKRWEWRRREGEMTRIT
jgi:hypothetical protein